MKKLKSFLETAQKMPKRSSALSIGIVLPEGISEDKVQKVKNLIKDIGFQSVMFTSRPELEKTLTLVNESEERISLVCLIPQEHFSKVSFSGLIDLMFKLDKNLYNTHA